MKRIYFIVCLCVVIGGIIVGNQYYRSDFYDLSLLLENIEALTYDESLGNERPAYINETKIVKNVDTKIEIGPDGVSVEYKRECHAMVTYCKHTGKAMDICYADLNGVQTISCGPWERN